MTKLIHREIILAAIETSYGTDAAPTGSDAMLVENIGWSNEGARMVERPMIRTSLGKLRQLYGGSLFQVTFDKEVKGSGTAGTAPEIGPLLRACGLAETVTVSDVSYQPASTGHDSLTIYHYEDGSVYKMTGARGTVEFSMETGGRIMGSFTFTGHVSGPTDEPLPTPTYEDTLPPIAINANFDIGGYGAIIDGVEASLNNELVTPPNINASDGYGEIRIVGRDMSGSFSPEATLVATKDFVGNWRDGAEEAMTTGVLGPTAGNQVKFDWPVVAYREVGPGDRDGIRTYELSCGFHESGGDDEMTITFT